MQSAGLDARDLSNQATSVRVIAGIGLTQILVMVDSKIIFYETEYCPYIVAKKCF
jgi:hypothetical protein